MSLDPVPLSIRTTRPGPAIARRPLRIRVRGDDERCLVEWEMLDALVRLAQSSRLDVEVECITSSGARVVLSLV